MHIRKSDVGRSVEFSGFNGERYNAKLAAYRKGIATLEYAVRKDDGELYICVAYLDHPYHNRIQPY